MFAFYAQLQPLVGACVVARRVSNKYRDYYFLPQFEAGQHELVELHHYTYEVDLHAMLGKGADKALSERVRAVNALLLGSCYFSTQRQADYATSLTHASRPSHHHTPHTPCTPSHTLAHPAHPYTPSHTYLRPTTTRW